MKLQVNHIEEILREMFSRVSVEYDEELVQQKNWFLTHTWSKEDQNSFREWLIAYLMKKRRCTKRMAEKNSAYMLLSFGWKVNE